MKHCFSLLLLLPLFFSFAFSKTSAAHDQPRYKSSISPIPMTMQTLMRKYTWHQRCPLPLQALAAVKLRYWGFDHKTHQGILIVNKRLASEVVQIFKTIYACQFPIQRMELMDVFKGDDKAAMKANNTSAFNCRAITGNPRVFSQHSYGRAIDINPLMNPYVKTMAGKRFMNHSESHPGKIHKNDCVYHAFTNSGWDWGGNWHELQDYQHFEKLI